MLSETSTSQTLPAQRNRKSKIQIDLIHLNPSWVGFATAPQYAPGVVCQTHPSRIGMIEVVLHFRGCCSASSFSTRASSTLAVSF